MKKNLLKFLVTFIVSILFGSIFIGNVQAEDNNQILVGKVTKIVSFGKETFMDELIKYQELEVKFLEGDKKDQFIVVKHSAAGMGIVDLSYEDYKIGDKLKIVINKDLDDSLIYSIDGQVKKDSLFLLLVLFIIVTIAVGRVWGFLSLLGLIISFLIIFKLIIPLIISGMNPVLAAVIGSTIIIPTTFYVSHGFNKKTHIGVISTFIALVFTGFLAVYFVEKTHLTGFASEEAGYLQVERQGSIDIRGLLLAGIIIGTLGILDDVTIGQASVVRQLKKANKDMNFFDLFKNGMVIGQDHISSMVNTLVLVYSGSALPLLLLFFGSEKSFIDIIEFELIAEEIVRMLVGSIGLVLSAPLSTVLAAYVFSRKNIVVEKLPAKK